MRTSGTMVGFVRALFKLKNVGDLVAIYNALNHMIQVD